MKPWVWSSALNKLAIVVHTHNGKETRSSENQDYFQPLMEFEASLESMKLSKKKKKRLSQDQKIYLWKFLFSIKLMNTASIVLVLLLCFHSSMSVLITQSSGLDIPYFISVGQHASASISFPLLLRTIGHTTSTILLSLPSSPFCLAQSQLGSKSRNISIYLYLNYITG